MEKLRIGVIGCGNIARSVHMPSLAEIKNCEVVAVCDHHIEKAQAFAQKYNIPRVYTLHHEFLAQEQGKVDAVYVLVKPDQTYWVASDALKAGYHVMMEKPAGINAYQANSLARIAAEVGKTAAVAMNRRHIPVLQEALKRVKAVSDIVQVDGRFMKFSDIDKGWHYASAYNCDIIHALDCVRYLAGSEVKNAASVVGRYDSPVDNAWNCVMLFENGVTGTLRANYRAATRVHDFEIHGPRASAFIDVGFPGRSDATATIVYGDGVSIYSAAAVGVNGTNVEVLSAREMTGEDGYYQYYGYKQEDQDFVDSILAGRAPKCTIADAAKSMELAEFLLEKRIN